MPKNPITTAQNKLIWVYAGKLGLSKEELEGVAQRITGAEKISQLSQTQAGWLINHLIKTAETNLLSKKQKKTILSLATQLGYDNEHLVNFIKRQTGRRKTVSGLSKPEATKVINGLLKTKDFEVNKQNVLDADDPFV